MAAEWICDGCGRREPAAMNGADHWVKPWDWFERRRSTDEDGNETGGMFDQSKKPVVKREILSACSRKCIDRVASKTGSHSVVMPV